MQITANGIALEVETHGPEDGIPLILIRGLSTQLVHWAPEFIAWFADHGYRVITFDNRDVGLSQRCPGPDSVGDPQAIKDGFAAGQPPAPAYALADMAQDVVGLMDSLGIDTAHVFGISMGGAITQLLVIDHPERFRTATIVMTAARLGDPSRLDKLLSWPMTRKEYIASELNGDDMWGSPGYPADHDYIVAQANAAYDRGVDAHGINRQLLATMSAGDRREALTKVDLPCFVIHGAEDTLIPPDAGREIAAHIPGAELQVLDGMGHVITPLLAPSLAAMVDEFIRRKG